MQLPDQVTIIEVGPRDGLQNENALIPTEKKIQFIHSLMEAGIHEMELTSFVSPKWVPQMKDAEDIISSCLDTTKRHFVLAPNKKGVDRLYKTSCKHVAVFVGISNTFNKKNINKTTAESVTELIPLIHELKEKGYFVRACISTSFYCPYEGKISEADVMSLCGHFVNAGVDELSVADTIGMANPQQVFSLFTKLKARFPHVLLTGHFHDTRGMAIANIYAALQAGTIRFDTSVGGLGGCPFAKGATGNVATEDVVFMMHQMGINTNIELTKLTESLNVIRPFLTKSLNSNYDDIVQKTLL
ncbi:hydroxymethylglutaryl-CoA lyase [Cytobacillus sp. Hm23]